MASERHNGKVIFSRDDEKESGDSDIWDDSALIKAYDNAMTKMKGLAADNVSSEKISKPHKGKKKHKQKKPRIKRWSVDDYCRAVYSADGLVYAAVIVSIDEQAQTCRVRYVDYDNEEDQPLAELRHARARKITTQSESGSVNSEIINGRTESAAQHSSHQHHRPSSSGHNMPPPPFPHPLGHLPRFPSHPSFGFPPWINRTQSSMPFIPPPPPPPLPDDVSEQDSEAMCSMLMSWYMSGYHTGYYQGLREGRKQSGLGQSPFR